MQVKNVTMFTCTKYRTPWTRHITYKRRRRKKNTLSKEGDNIYMCQNAETLGQTNIYTDGQHDKSVLINSCICIHMSVSVRACVCVFVIVSRVGEGSIQLK